MEAPLYRYDDVCEAAADAVRCIDARLQDRGLQLAPTASEALRQTLEGILRLMEVEFLDYEGNPVDPETWRLINDPETVWEINLAKLAELDIQAKGVG